MSTNQHNSIGRCTLSYAPWCYGPGLQNCVVILACVLQLWTWMCWWKAEAKKTEEKIEGKEINKESQVRKKDRGRRKGYLPQDVRIECPGHVQCLFNCLEHLGTEHSWAQQRPWHYLHSATVATVVAKRSHETSHPGITSKQQQLQQSSYTAWPPQSANEIETWKS